MHTPIPHSAYFNVFIRPSESPRRLLSLKRFKKDPFPQHSHFKCKCDSKTTPTFLPTFQVCTVCDSADSNARERTNLSCPCPVASRYVIYHVWTSLSLSLSAVLRFKNHFFLSFFLSFKQKRYIITSSRNNPLLARVRVNKHCSYVIRTWSVWKFTRWKEIRKKLSKLCHCIINRVGVDVYAILIFHEYWNGIEIERSVPHF